MGVPLKGLLGKNKRAIIVNGELLRIGRNQVAVGLSNYHTEYTVLGTGETLSEEKGDELIMSRIAAFDDVFSGMPLYKKAGALEGDTEVQVCADPYTGALVIESEVYRALYAPHMHEVGVQHTVQVADLVQKFVTQYTMNYMDLFVYLYNKRITSPHSSIATKCHLTAGFFQPLIVESQSIRSPFTFGQNKWLHSLFADDEKYLERPFDSPRKLNLSCVAMCDIASKFNVAVIPEFDKRHWMLLCMMVLLSQLDREVSLQLSKQYGTFFQKIRDDQASMDLFSAMLIYADKTRKAVRVI